MARPDGLGPAGQQLWKDVTSEYELVSRAARNTLEEACRLADRLNFARARFEDLERAGGVRKRK